MTDNPNALAETYVAAWKAKDFKTLRSILADDATFNGPLAHLHSAEDLIDGLLQMSEIVTDIVVHKRLADDTDAITWFDPHTSVAPPMATANWSTSQTGRSPG